MAVYKNIDGTTKPSFKIGVRGITIRTDAIISGEETLEKVVIEKNGVSKRLAYEEEIPKGFCSRIVENKDDNTVSFYLQGSEDKPIVVSRKTGGVTGPDTSVINNLVAFASTDGQQIKDAEVSVKNTIALTEDGKGSTGEVPSAAAVVNYVGSISDLLEKRVRGKY